jgi:hypothetical protein
MPLVYVSGERIQAGDQVRYHGELGQIEFVVEAASGDPATDWYLQEMGPGVMVHELRAFGRVYVTNTGHDALLEFVSRTE